MRRFAPTAFCSVNRELSDLTSFEMSQMQLECGQSPICVTGASGYIAMYIIKQLLEKGYHVRGTVRSVSNEEKIAPLKALAGSENLEFVEADLSRSENYDDILRGCHALIHTATPIGIAADGSIEFKSEEELQKHQMEPALNGTRDLFMAAARCGLRRVVLTSSTAAMRRSIEPLTKLDESCWSDEESLRSVALTNASAGYCLAKTMQERLAWKLADELGLDLVTINPGVVMGPCMTERASVSVEFILMVGTGRGMPWKGCRSGTVPDGFCEFVDVRNVGEAHVAAMENGAAHGRYLLLTNRVHYEDVARVMRGVDKRFGGLPVDSVDGRRRAVEPYVIDNSKAQSLGLSVYDWEETVAETARVFARYRQ